MAMLVPTNAAVMALAGNFGETVSVLLFVHSRLVEISCQIVVFM
jgi:hypothetical protein